MPGILDDLRAQFPEFREFSDQQLAEAAAPMFGGSVDASAQFLGIPRAEPGFKSALKGGLAQYAVGAGRALEDVGADQIGRGVRRYGEDVQFRNPTQVHDFSSFAEHPWQGVKELTGQAIGSSLPALVPYAGPIARGLGTAGTVAAGTAAAAIPSYGGIRATQDQTGEQNIPGAALGALASGAIEQFGGMQRLMRPATGRVLANGLPTDLLAEMSKTPLRTFGRQALRVAGEEGLEEIAQNPIEQYAGGQNPADPAQLADTAFSGFGGFVGGLPFGGLSGARRAFQQRSAQDYVAGTLTNPMAPQDARLDAATMQQHFMGGGPEGQAWYDNMRLGIQEDLNRMRAQQLAQGAPLDLLNLGNDLGLLDQQAPSMPEPQGSIYDTINQNQGALQAMPHAAPAMQPGTPAEPPVNRAASIFASLAGKNVQPNSQEAVDLDWATEQLQKSMSPQAFAAFQAQVAMDSAGQKVKGAPKVVRAGAGTATTPPAASTAGSVPPSVAAPQTLGAKFKAAGGRVSNVVKALDSAKTPEEAVDVVRQWIEKPSIASSTLRALEELHKQLTGFTYEQHLRQQEAADVRQGGSGQTVPAGNGQAQGAKPGTQVQPARAQGQRPAQPDGQGPGKVAVSDPAKRAQLAETVVKSLRPEDQEVLGFLQQHGEKAFERLGEKWGITRQAARYRVLGQRDREGNLVVDPRSGAPKQLGIVDRISNIVAKHGLTVDDLLAGFKPRVYESTEARTGLSPKLNESQHQEEALSDESPVEQGTGTVASAGGSQSDWKESSRDKELAKEVPGYAERLAEEQRQQAGEPAQELIPAAQGEKVDERIAEREGANADYTNAERWWEQERDNSPQVPKFEDLADRHQEEVIQAVKSGEANGRLQKRVIAEFNEPSYFSKGRALAEKEQEAPGVQRALKQLKTAGQYWLLDKVRSVRASAALDGKTDGLFTRHSDGSFSIVFAEGLLSGDPLQLAHTLRHELSHVLDAVNEFKCSLSQQLEAVLPELKRVYERGTALGQYLGYPFNRAEHGVQSEAEFRAEVFAQLNAAWTTKFGRDLIQREAPQAAAFMRAVNEDAKVQGETGVREGRQGPVEERVAADRGQVGRVLRHTAFHGTPHNVHEAGGFTTQKIGTGEGAQAYGWGLYFASNKAVAKWYRDKLSRRQVRGLVVDGKELKLDANSVRDITDRAFAIIERAGKGENVSHEDGGVVALSYLVYNNHNVVRHDLRDSAKDLRDGGRAESANWAEAALQWLSRHDVERREEGGGRLYQVELAPKEDEYLDWDKPLSQQSEKVQEAIPADVVSMAMKAYDTRDPRGSELYNAAGKLYREQVPGMPKDVTRPDPEKASKALLAAGIPGIRYLDQGSRTHGEGSHNFVIFDDKHVTIKSFENRGTSIESSAPEVTAKPNRETGKVEIRLNGELKREVQFAAPGLLRAFKGDALDRVVRDRMQQARDQINRAVDEVRNGAMEEQPLSRYEKRFLEAEQAVDRLLKGYVDGTLSPEDRAAYNQAAYILQNMDLGLLRASIKNRTYKGTQSLKNRGTSIERAQTEVTTRLGDVWAKFKPTLLTLHQLVDQFGDKLQTLKDYVLSMDKMEQRHHEILNGAHKVTLDWQKLPTRVRQQLDSVMQRATLRGIHPDEDYGTGGNDHLTDRGEYDSLKQAYDALPADAKATYKAVRKMLDDNWAARKAAFARSATHAYEKLLADAAGDQKRVAELTQERDQIIADHAKAIASLKGPYFPLLRFGDYLVIARSKELVQVQDDLEKASGADRTALQKRVDSMKRQASHYAVEAYENRYEAETAAGHYKARGMDARAQLAEEHHKSLQPMAAGAIDKISAGISDQFDKATASKLKHAITELYISSLPEHAALQRQLKRKGIQGATEDMLRAVEKAVEKDSFYLARLEYADEIADNLFKLKQESKKAGIDYQHVYNNLAARLALDFEYKPTPVQNALAKLSAVWHLGMSPAYLLTNATQPWMITAPVLAGRFGAGRAFAALRSAWVDAANIIRQSKTAGAFADIDFKGVGDAQEREMLERIVQRGQIDITQNVDMGLVAEGTDPKYLKLQKAFNWANQHVEASNRITTALASYRLARQRGMSHDDAADFAYKAVVDTQLDYSNANAAYWMKSGAVPLGKLIFQFRKYQQGMLYLMARNAQLAFKGDKDALRALGYLAAMQLAFAGAVGIPVVTAPLAAIGMFVGGGDDEKGDAETQLRNYLADLMGPEAARAFWKGLPTLMGLDVSQRVGMGDFWKPLPFLRLTGKTGADSMGQLLLQTLGAPFGTLTNAWDAGKFFEKGDWVKGTEKLLPKMLADPLKAARYAGEGLTSRSGNQVLSPDKMDGWDIALRAAGFSPTVESEHYAAQASKETTAQAIKDRRDNLLAKYAQAKQRGEDTGDMLEAINKFNQDHPTAGYRIDRSSMLKAVQSRRKGAGELDEAGVRFAKKDRPLSGIDRYAYGT